MKLSSALVMSLFCFGALRAEEGTEVTPEKATALLEEKREVVWTDASIEMMAEEIVKVAGINVIMTSKLRKEVGTDAKASVKAGSLAEALDLGGEMLGFTWFLDGTMLYIETGEEGAERVRVVEVDLTPYLAKAKPEKDVQAMTKEEAAKYDAELLAESKHQVGLMMKHLKEQGLADDETSSLVPRAGVLEIHGKKAFIDAVREMLSGPATGSERPR